MFIKYNYILIFLFLFLLNIPVSAKDFKSWIEIRDENVERQQHDYSCGTSSLTTILKYFYSIAINEEIVLEYLNHIRQKDGKELYKITFKDLQIFSKEMEFQAVGISINKIDKLYKIKLPLILQIEIRGSKHFTVFKGIDKKYVYLADPSLGNLKLKINKFKTAFYFQKEDSQGRALVIFPKEKNNINKEFMNKIEYSNFVYDAIINQFNSSVIKNIEKSFNHKLPNSLKF